MGNSSALSRFLGDNNEESESLNAVKPERNLLSAVLARAICDAFGTAHCERHIVRSARQWLFGKLAPTKPFSFAWVCLNLDLNPLELQDTLRTYEENPEDIQDRLALLK